MSPAEKLTAGNGNMKNTSKNPWFWQKNPASDKIFRKTRKIAIFIGNKSTSSLAILKGGERYVVGTVG